MKLYIGFRDRIIDGKRAIVHILALCITEQHIVSVGGAHLSFRSAWRLGEEIASHSNGSIILQVEIGALDNRYLQDWIDGKVDEL
jgi:hypothetical protein